MSNHGWVIAINLSSGKRKFKEPVFYFLKILTMFILKQYSYGYLNNQFKKLNNFVLIVNFPKYFA